MRISTLCLWSASLSLAAARQPTSVRELGPAETQVGRYAWPEYDADYRYRTLSGSRNKSQPKGKKKKKKKRKGLLKKIEELLSSASPTSGWPGVPLSAEEFAKLGHAAGVPQWGGYEPPINDKDFCTIVRAMGWIAYSLRRQAEQVLPVNSVGISPEPSEERGELVTAIRMMMAWEKLSKTLRLQLDWTPVLYDQMHCALCYAEYCSHTSNWLAALRDQARHFNKTDPMRRVVYRRLGALAAAHRRVAKKLHGSKPWNLIREKIPQKDESGWGQKLAQLHGLGPGSSLRRLMEREDPVTRGQFNELFKEAKEAWVWKEKEWWKKDGWWNVGWWKKKKTKKEKENERKEEEEEKKKQKEEEEEKDCGSRCPT